MKKKISLFAASAALIAVPVLAAPGGKMGDADGNGVLTRAEAQAHATEMFAKMDANGDGKLDRSDREAKRAEMQAKMFERLDANKDGSISKAEWDQHAADRAAKRDGWRERRMADADAAPRERGKRDGHRGMRGGHGMMMMAKADTDGDKAISQAEFQAAALARFDAADANKDGQVTAEERQAAREAMRAAWKAKRTAAASSADAD